VVGELNPRGGPALHPGTPSGARLAKILGGLYARFDRTNLCRGRWSAVEAAWRAELIGRTDLRHGTPVVLLGSRVARAFGVPYRPFRRRRGTNVLVLPHPSGLCRTWNDRRNAARARRAVRRLVG